MTQPAYFKFKTAPNIELRAASFDPAGPVRGEMLFFLGKGELIPKYEQLVREASEQGLRITLVEPRGQGGSTRELPDRRMIHSNDFRNHEADIKAVAERWLEDRQAKNVPAIYGAHSMSALTSLGTLLKNKDLQDKFSRIILSDPPVQTRLSFPERRYVRTMNAAFSTSYARGEKEWDPATATMEATENTSDPAQHKRWQDILKDPANKDVVTAGVSYGWITKLMDYQDEVKAAIAKGARLDPAKTLMIIPDSRGVLDKPFIPHGAVMDVARNKLQLPDSSIYEAVGGLHETFFERAEIRDPAMQRVKQHIESVLPRAQPQRRGELDRGIKPSLTG